MSTTSKAHTPPPAGPTPFSRRRESGSRWAESRPTCPSIRRARNGRSPRSAPRSFPTPAAWRTSCSRPAWPEELSSSAPASNIRERSIPAGPFECSPGATASACSAPRLRTGAPRTLRSRPFSRPCRQNLAWTRSGSRSPTPKAKSKGAKAWVLPLDHDGSGWVSVPWKLKTGERMLNAAEGPAGLRLPLNLLPPDVPRRALVAELDEGRLCLFFPPLQQPAFTELVRVLGESISAAKIGLYELQGYVPEDTEKVWTTLGLAADPGVLEINLPPCMNWQEYDGWIHEVTTCAERVGLRSWKQPYGDYPGGTGGGNHLLWGGPSIEENPFLSRPAWLASILRHFQRHPSLAYLFTGSYVGSSSQAPRPDESSKELFDLEMAYHFSRRCRRAITARSSMRPCATSIPTSRGMPIGPRRVSTSFGTLAGRAGALGSSNFEPSSPCPPPNGCPRSPFSGAAWAALGAAKPATGPLRVYGGELQDRFFLPSCLFADLESLFDDCAAWDAQSPATCFARSGTGAFRSSFPTAMATRVSRCAAPTKTGRCSARLLSRAARRAGSWIPRCTASRFA